MFLFSWCLSLTFTFYLLSFNSVMISCKNHSKTVGRKTNLFTLKPKDLFVGTSIKGLVNRDQFARHSNTRRMPIDWGIIDSFFDSNDSAVDLKNEHDSQFKRTRNQCVNVSLNEQSQPTFTSTPKRRRFDRSESPSQSPNITGHVVPPPGEFDFFDDDINLLFHRWNSGQLSPISNVSSFQSSYDETTGITSKAIVGEIEDSEGDPLYYTEFVAKLGNQSIGYDVIKKLISSWKKDFAPVKFDDLLKVGCNRVEAAKTFSLLLGE